MFYTCGFNGLTVCVCVFPCTMVPLYFPILQVHLVAMRVGFFISVRRRASDGSCGRVTSVFLSFSGLHESEQCRCVVDVVSVLVSTVGDL